MDTPDRVARRLVVHGRVQGVSFRAHVADRADVATVERAAREGPRLARVERVDAEDVAPRGATGFSRA